MKRFALSFLALFLVASCAHPQCVGRRGLLPASTFSVPQYSCYGCSGCYGVPQQAPVPTVPACATCQTPQQTFFPQQQYQPQYDVAPVPTAPACAPQQQLSYAPQQALYAPQASFAPQYVQRSFAPSYAPSYAVGAAFAPGYAVAPVVQPVVFRQRFFAPRFLGPPVHHFPRPHALGFGLGTGFAPGFAPGFGGGGGFFFRGRNVAFGRF